MAFAAIHIPDFPVQAVVRAEPSHGDAAIALVAGTPPVWNVVAVNQAASRLGVDIGCTRALAEQFESLQIRSRSPVQEKAAHAALLDLAWSISPRVEDTAADMLAIDLSGLSSLFGTEQEIASLLQQRVAAMGLTANVAVSANLETAICAARGFEGITLIPPGKEPQRLAGLPLAALGASQESLATLNLWGVRTCAALAEIPLLQLSERLGQQGVRLHQGARGAVMRSLVLAEPAAHFEEQMELDEPVEELEPLSFLLGRLLDQLCLRLHMRSLAASIVHLRFRLDPTGLKDVQVHNDASRRKKRCAVYEKTVSLPVPMRDPKMLLGLLRLRLQGDRPSAPILKIYMAIEPARPRAVQAGLFMPPSPDVAKLELTISRLANLVGEANVGSPQLVDTHRSGEFRMQRFAPPREETKAERPKPSRRQPVEPATWPDEMAEATIGFRMFRPPLPASVHLQNNRPKKISFRGVRGEVVAASGPWRTSGDWWREDAWHQDEWDLEIRFPIAPDRAQRSPGSCPQQGLYRFYFDSITRRWFVRGLYD